MAKAYRYCEPAWPKPPQAPALTFLLDTETGATWQATNLTARPGPPAWVYMQKLDSAADIRKLLDKRQLQNTPLDQAKARLKLLRERQAFGNSN